MTTVQLEGMTLKECAAYGNVTNQAIYVAILKGKLKATKKCAKWTITKEDYDQYRCNKYVRELRKIEGQYIYDIEKGHFSVPQVSKILTEILNRNITTSHIYYMLNRGQIRGFRKGIAWIILKEDALLLLEQERMKDVQCL